MKAKLFLNYLIFRRKFLVYIYRYIFNKEILKSCNIFLVFHKCLNNSTINLFKKPIKTVAGIFCSNIATIMEEIIKKIFQLLD